MYDMSKVLKRCIVSKYKSWPIVIPRSIQRLASFFKRREIVKTNEYFVKKGVIQKKTNNVRMKNSRAKR